MAISGESFVNGCIYLQVTAALFLIGVPEGEESISTMILTTLRKYTSTEVNNNLILQNTYLPFLRAYFYMLT